ncbi:DUF3231 family protein [Fredinandcohnia humi]
MDKHNIRLSSAEIGGLWTTYLQSSMGLCLLKYFLHHLKDEEIKEILKKTYSIYTQKLKDITMIFREENIPIPDGFSDDDINLSAPPLFYDPFALTFAYSMCRMNIVNFGFITSNMAREDVRGFFSKALANSLQQYNDCTELMLKKGIYDRPPMIVYPSEVEYIEKKTYISKLLGEKRPLNVNELTDMFFNIERNYFAINLCSGLLQVVKDKEIFQFIKEGKEICEKQVNFLNDLLKEEDLLGQVPTSMEVTGSTVSPFSDKLIVTLFNTLNSIDVTLIGHALSLSLRTDLITFYSKMIVEILAYSGKGFNILVNRKWMEEPPHALDRRKIQKPF